MKLLVADAEWNPEDNDQVHCLSCKVFDSSDPVLRFTEPEPLRDYVEDLKPDRWVFHNGISADLPVLNKHGWTNLSHKDILDTFVISRLVDYSKFNTHSLKELGLYLGVHKGDYTGGWDVYTESMGEYCDQDVVVTEAILNLYRKEVFSPDWAKAMRVEHDMAWVSHQIQDNGFLFDTDEAQGLLDLVQAEKTRLEESFQTSFKPTLVEVNRIKYRTKQDGTLFANVIKAISEYPKTEVDGEELVCYDYKLFNPGSPQDRIDVLWDAGWKPFDRTKGHNKKLREVRNARYLR